MKRFNVEPSTRPFFRNVSAAFDNFPEFFRAVRSSGKFKGEAYDSNRFHYSSRRNAVTVELMFRAANAITTSLER
jgi:hypothetical protein